MTFNFFFPFPFSLFRGISRSLPLYPSGMVWATASMYARREPTITNYSPSKNELNRKLTEKIAAKQKALEDPLESAESDHSKRRKTSSSGSGDHGTRPSMASSSQL
jgi:hypothetical protein